MDCNYNFKLLTNVENRDQTKEAKKRFPKLTLSSNKKKACAEMKINQDLSKSNEVIKYQMAFDKNTGIIDVVKENVSQNVSKSDDEELFSQKLEVIESDYNETQQLSSVEINTDIFQYKPKQNNNIKVVHILEPKYSRSESLFSSYPRESDNLSSDFFQNKFKNDIETDVGRLSTQMENIAINDNNKLEHSSLHDIPENTTSHSLNNSILSISSASEVVNKTSIEEKIIESSIEIDYPIIISDSDSEEYFDHVSTLGSNNKSIGDTALKKINDFFNNIPSPYSAVNIHKKSCDEMSDTEKNKSQSILSSIKSGNVRNNNNNNNNNNAVIKEQNPVDISGTTEEELEETPISNNKTQSEDIQITKKILQVKDDLVETINISAKIKINIQISQLDVTSSSESEQLSSSKEDNEENISLNNSIVMKENDVGAKSLNASDELNKTKSEIDEDMQKILNKVYGTDWQTPQMLKMCSVKKTILPQLKHNETIDDNFKNFHNNMRSDLESTRIPTQEKFTTDKKTDKTESDDANIFRSKKITKNKQTNRMLNFKTDQFFKSRENIKSRQLPKVNKFDSDSSDSPDNSKELYKSSNDSSFEISDLSNISLSSEDDENEKKYLKNKKTKGRKKHIKAKKHLFGMDTVELIESDSDASDFKENLTPNSEDSISKKTKKLLESCEFKKKTSVPPTPIFKLPLIEKKEEVIKTKRKLFTPKYDEININEINDVVTERKITDKIEFKDDNLVKFTEPIPKLFTFNKKSLTNKEELEQLIVHKKQQQDNKNSKTSKKTDSVSKIKPFITSDKDTIHSYSFLKSLDVMTPKSLCHPEALYYRDNYKTKKIELSTKLFELYNETVFNNVLNVPISWNKKLLNTAGRCKNLQKGQIRSCKIELSDKVLTGADRLRCTLIHEMCHAVTWILNGENGHGKTWKNWASKAMHIYPELPKIGVCHQYDIEYKYTYQCVKCFSKSHAHSKSKKVQNIRCSYCHGSIQIFLNKKNKDGNIVQTPVKEASGFAKFVQDKYKDFKKPHNTHAEVMKLLGAEFSQLSVKKNTITKHESVK